MLLKQGITQIEELTRKFTKKLSLYGDNEFALLDKNSSTQHPASERVETEEKNSFAQKVDFKSSFFNDEVYFISLFIIFFIFNRIINI